MNTNKKIWYVVVAYDCWLGGRGTIVSKHATYALASAKLRKAAAHQSFLGIKHAG